MSVDMKKVIIAIISIMCFTISVNAAATYSYNVGSTEYNNLETQYNKGIQKTNINSEGFVTLYGFSSCVKDGKCEYKYAKTSSDYKEVLKSSVTCTGGQKHISVDLTGPISGFKTDNADNHDGKVYWSEEFYVKCYDIKNSNTLTLNNEVSPGGQIDGGTSNGGTSSNGSATGEYGSSTTTENSGTGVETYYIVLGIVGIISYVIMNVVKKQNLFKNI